MNRILKFILLTICLAVFIYSANKIYNYIREGKDNKRTNEELIEKAIVYNDTKDEEKKEEGEIEKQSEIPFNVDFTILKQENKDIIGWIYSKNTPINYPILQSNDNEKYLRRLYTGKYNTAGSLFMDYRNNSNFTDENTIIYGHNMKNNAMFGTLPKYKKQEYYEEHKDIYILTPEKKYKIELFAGYTESVDSKIYNLNKITENEKEEIVKKSDFKTNVQLQELDKIITLSTCSYTYDGARYIIMGRLQEI